MERDAQLSLPGAAGVPQAALDYLGAVRRHWASPSPPLLQDVHIAALLHLSIRQWQRIKHDLRTGRWGGYDWLEGTWPPLADWHPQWEQRLQLVRDQADEPLVMHGVDTRIDQDGNPVAIEYEEVYDSGGVLLSRRLVKPPRNGTVFGHLSALAAVGAYALLDMRDGRMDGVMHWCHVLLEHVTQRL